MIIILPRVNLVCRVHKDLEDLKVILATKDLLVFQADLVLTDSKDPLEPLLNLHLPVTKECPVRTESRADLEDPVFQVTWDCVDDQDFPDYTDSKEKLVTEVCPVSTQLSDLKESLVREALPVCRVLLVHLVKMACLVLPVSKVFRATRDRLVCRAIQDSME